MKYDDCQFGFIKHPLAKFDSLIFAPKIYFNEDGQFNNESFNMSKIIKDIEGYSKILNLTEEFLYDFFEQYHHGSNHAGKPEWCFNREYNQEVLEKINSFFMARMLQGENNV